MANIEKERLENLNTGVLSAPIYATGFTIGSKNLTNLTETGATDLSDIAKSTGFGNSRYDKYVETPYQLENLENTRALHQSGFMKLVNGLGKMATTAATTTLDTTLGTLYGVGKYAYNHVFDDGKLSFLESQWDNSFNKAMLSFQEKMESVMPNYYTDQEKENAWYNNIFTANFWGDKFFKNMGFTIGAMASMAVPGFNTGFGVGRLASNITKGIVGTTTRGLRAADKAGKIATRLATGLISANGEANVEAYHAAKAFTDNNINILNTNKEKLLRSVEQELQDNLNAGMSSRQAIQIADQKNAQIEQEYNDIKAKIKQESTSVGNLTHLLNIAALTVSNNIEFGRLLSGGWKSNKAFLGTENLTLKIAGKETKDAVSWGKALAKGENATIEGEVKKVLPSVLKGATRNMLTEGTEELTQNLISGTEQAYHSALINKDIKNRSKRDKWSLYKAGIDPETTAELVDWTKALGKVWTDEFGKASGGGWEEFFLGSLTGGLGTISIRQKGPSASHPEGRVGISWQGGFYEAFKEVQEKNAENELKASYIRNQIEKPEFKERTQRAIAAMTIAENMDKALIDDDILTYKNMEMFAIANDALFFKNSGLLDGYKAYYEEIAKGLSDLDVENIKHLTSVKADRQDTGETVTRSFLDGKTNDEIKQLFKDKAVSTLSKIDSILDSYDKIYAEHINDFLDQGIPAQQAEFLVREAATQDAVIKDMQRRKLEVEQEQNTTKNKADYKGDAYYNKALKDLDKAINDAEKELDTTLKDPKKRLEDWERIQKVVQDKEIGKDKDKTLQSYMTASTIQDIANTFYFSDTDHRHEWFNEALKNVETQEQKQLFKNFGVFVEQARFVEEKLSDILEKNNLTNDSELQEQLGDIIDNILHGITESPTAQVLDTLLPNEIRAYAEILVKQNPNDLDATVYAYALNMLATSLEDIAKNVEEQYESQEKQVEEDKLIESVEEELSSQNETEPELQTDTDKQQDTTSENVLVLQSSDEETEGQLAEESDENYEVTNEEELEENVEEEIEESEEDVEEDEEKEEAVVTEENTEENTPITQSTEVNTSNFTYDIPGMYVQYRLQKNSNGILGEQKNRMIIEYLSNLPGKQIDLDYIVNNILPKIWEQNEKIPIYFARFKENDKYIYTVIKKENVPEDINNTYGVVLNNATIDDKYIIVGTFVEPFSTKQDPIILERKKVYKTISKNLSSNLATKTDNLFVSSIFTEINGFNAGDKQSSTDLHDINKLLENAVTNPNNLTIKNLAFAVIRRDKDGIAYPEYIGTNGKEPKLNSKGITPGQVYLLLQDLHGTYVPILLSAAPHYNEYLKDNKKAIFNELSKAINNLYSNTATVADKERNLAIINSLLVFNKEIKPFLDEKDNNKIKSNVRELSSKEEFETFLKKYNPGLNISIETLKTYPELLLDDGILQAHIKSLGFVNVMPYLKPIQQDSTIVNTGNTHTINKQRTKQTLGKEYTINNNQYYRSVNGTWERQNDDGSYIIVTNDAVLDCIAAILDNNKLCVTKFYNPTVKYEDEQAEYFGVSLPHSTDTRYFMRGTGNSFTPITDEDIINNLVEDKGTEPETVESKLQDLNIALDAEQSSTPLETPVDTVVPSTSDNIDESENKSKPQVNLKNKSKLRKNTSNSKNNTKFALNSELKKGYDKIKNVVQEKLKLPNEKIDSRAKFIEIVNKNDKIKDILMQASITVDAAIAKIKECGL